MPTDLRGALLDAATSHAEDLAFVEGDRRLTYAALLERASARAAGMRARGVIARDRVAIVMAPGLPVVETFWAAVLLGATPCILNPTVGSDVLRRRVALTRPALVLTDDDEVPATAETPPDPGVGPEDIAYLQLTSGTTGEPRVGLVRYRNVVALFRDFDDLDLFRPGDVSVCWVPPWHDLGLVRFILEPVWRCMRCHLVMPAISTIGEWLRTISAVRGTHSGAPDFAYRLATRMVDPADLDLRSLRFCTNGGEPPRRSTIEAFERRFGISGAVQPGYGLGEAVLAVTTQLPGEPLTVDERGNVACGRPIESMEVRAGVSAEEPADILVRGPAIFAGYLDAPDETAATLANGWLHTGDVGYLDAESRLYVLGRRGGMIKRSGAQVAARELEEGALRVEGVRTAAAVALPDTTDAGTDTVVVVVEASVEDEAALRASVSREVAAEVGFAPGRVVVLAPRALPRTENGKIRYAALTELLAADARAT